jgi:hypothetical protein
VESALPQAQLLLNGSNGIVRVGVATSKDHPGQGAIAFYIDSSATPSVQIPSAIGDVPTVVLPAKNVPGLTAPGSTGPGSTGPGSTAANSGVAGESAPVPLVQLRATSLAQALAVKQRVASTLMKSSPAIFGVGVGQSLDNPADAAIVLYVDRHKAYGDLPASIEGQRVRAILMDRLHVTRAHGAAGSGHSSCASRRPNADGAENGVEGEIPGFLEDRIKLPE